MAPEVVTGEREPDRRADLFAVGVILYELTVGRRLYEGPAMRVMAAIADGPLSQYSMCDWIDNAATFQMGHADGPVYGYIHLPCRVEVNARLAGSQTLLQESANRG